MQVDVWGVVTGGLFAPAILFFVFGLLTVAVKSDLAVPRAMSTAMSIFLLVAIGLEGGAEAVEAIGKYPEILGAVITVAIMAAICGIIFAFLSAKILKGAGLNTADAWAAGGHYGAVSSATLAVGVSMANAARAAAPEQLIYGGWMPAMYPFMDSPALITAILFGRLALAKAGGAKDAMKPNTKEILHHSVFGMAVWLLVCSLIIGMLSQHFSPMEMCRTLDFFDGMFRGVLALFLIDMGITAAKQLGALKSLGRNLIKVVAIAFAMPQIWGVIGIFGIYGMNLLMPGTIGWGDAFVFATIAGGCSFISAPAAMRIAIPEANPSVYLPMSVALTFPFNIVIGLPLWKFLCMFLWGAL